MSAHRSRKVREFAIDYEINLEYLPPYAPELNPVELVWSQLKYHELGNYCPENIGQLALKTKSHLLQMKRNKKLIKQLAQGVSFIKNWL